MFSGIGFSMGTCVIYKPINIKFCSVISVKLTYKETEFGATGSMCRKVNINSGKERRYESVVDNAFAKNCLNTFDSGSPSTTAILWRVFY